MDWITDRLPTEADGDFDGDVVVMCSSARGWYTTDWEAVRSGEPWLPFKPPSADAASVTPVASITSQPRRIVSISRTVLERDIHTIDAIADDGTAWWMIAGVTDGWTQLPALPDRG